MATNTLIFSVSLESGDFEAKLRVPLPATKEQMGDIVERWLALVAAGIASGAEELAATLAKEPTE